MSASPPATARSRLLPLAIAAAVISACSTPQLQIDRTARAPVIDGFGASTLQPSKAKPAARVLFAQGIAQVYAFNGDEAIRAFKAALAQDPDCALCAWGVAYQMGPNINDPDRGDLKEAIKYASYARAHSAGASPRDLALIDALVLRYGHAKSAPEVAIAAALCRAGGKAGGEKPIPSTSPTPNACATSPPALLMIPTCFRSTPKPKWSPRGASGGTTPRANRPGASENWPTWSKRAWCAIPSMWA